LSRGIDVRYELKDFGDSLGSNLCTIVALFALYQTAFMYWVFITLSVEVKFRVNMHVSPP
jgi:hypothetical protein